MTTVAESPAPISLLVRFGNQERAKCPGCRCFMTLTETDAACGRCDAIYDRLPDGRFQKRVML